ncbi:MAG: coproporphyrinogen dehydrogenase HemZ [Oscillibacter sp.]|nr:coproporphyrinogen dehydrogenase HemZ [Oscillibacter sp.]
MKLELRGHNERYTVEQSMLNLFPGELPVYGTLAGDEPRRAVVELSETGSQARIAVELSYDGKTARKERTEVLPDTEYEKERIRRRGIGRCFYDAAIEVTGTRPPWGMLSGVRPDKLVTAALLSGKSEAEARRMLEETYAVTPERAALALETGRTAYRTALQLGERDIAVYVGVPFCPTRCAYCSFVSQSVEKSFKLVEPYLEALTAEIREGGALARRLGLRVRAFYMGGGTPTTLTPRQLSDVLTAFETSFDTSYCTERTVEAGRPDTITAEKLSVLRAHGVDRVSVNPQSMEDGVLRAIGRRHTAADVERAMELASAAGFPHINMDVIAGLPADTPAGFERTLRRCVAFAPDNLTVHTLALKKGSRVLTEGLAIPDAASVGAMLDFAAPTLRGAGYAPYYLYRQKYMSGSFENIGWAKPGAECLYNIVIMSELCAILSFGAGGSTKLVDRRANRIRRLFHPKYAEEYIARPEKRGADFAEIAAFYGDA